MARSRSSRREEILDATCDLIAEKGVADLRVADVADRIGTASGTVHYHFKTKQELLHAAFEQNYRSSIERRQPILDSDLDPLGRLRSFIESYLPRDDQVFRAWRVWSELWFQALHDDRLMEINEAVYGEWRAVVAGMLRDGQAYGLIRSGDPVVWANCLISMIDGLAIQVMLHSKTMNVDRMAQACHQFIDELAATTDRTAYPAVSLPESTSAIV